MLGNEAQSLLVGLEVLQVLGRLVADKGQIPELDSTNGFGHFPGADRVPSLGLPGVEFGAVLDVQSVPVEILFFSPVLEGVELRSYFSVEVRYIVRKEDTFVLAEQLGLHQVVLVLLRTDRGSAQILLICHQK